MRDATIAQAPHQTETPEQAHQRRLQSMIARWERARDVARQRGQRSEVARAERMLALAERAQMAGVA